MKRTFFAALLLVAGALPNCGARTGLLGGEVPCSVEGEERVCFTECGEGRQICRDGYFDACAVPPVTRRCVNECGSGLQQCVDGEWRECAVPRKEEACSNACGSGLRACEHGRWGECEVPANERPCENLCGTGVQRCEDGMFGVCEVPIRQLDCASVCGPGHESCVDGAWQPCDAPLPNPPDLEVVIRDFRIEHPDFEFDGCPNMVETGIVAEVLGADDTPTYQGDPVRGTCSTTGADNFYEWYHDVSGVNLSAAFSLELGVSPQDPGLFVYRNTSFFPIDMQLFGNEGNTHNFHFTLAATTKFQYVGGEVFRFTGDDDMWVFVNRRLAIDLGGLHQPRPASVELDRIAGTHGLVIGNEYPLHFFFAERHTIESNFTIETSIAEPGSCD